MSPMADVHRVGPRQGLQAGHLGLHVSYEISLGRKVPCHVGMLLYSKVVMSCSSYRAGSVSATIATIA